MKAVIVLLSLVISACVHRGNRGSEDKAVEGRAIGEFEGYGAINERLATRLLDDSDSVSANFEIQKLFGSSADSIKALFGGYPDEGEQHIFQNGEPNPIGALLWYQVTGNLASAVSEGCVNGSMGDGTFKVSIVKPQPPSRPIFELAPGAETDQPPTNVNIVSLKLRQNVKNTLDKICSADPNGLKSATDSLARQILTAATPTEVRQDWASVISQDQFTVLSQKERVQLLLHTLLMHPYFILVI